MTKRTLHTIDSHTAGEPTRVVIRAEHDLGSHFDLGDGTLADQVDVFRERFDHLRSAVVMEPRGSDLVVGAILRAPENESSSAGVIFFNNAGFLGMCGHGMIGVAETLKELGRLDIGRHRIDTPVGTVGIELHEDHSISIENVASYREHRDVAFTLASGQRIIGDVVWGGNWFFLAKEPTFDVRLQTVDSLRGVALEIRDRVHALGHTKVDHIELFASTTPPGTNAKNFVLCPGSEYDRSPCGTGTSAKLACLAADGALAPEEVWIQAGVIDTTFQGSYRWENESRGRVLPTIRGRAWVTAKSTLIFDDSDPFRWGIR